MAILKHTNPCGVASADDLATAWDYAYATDRQAPFGGIIVVNNTLDLGLASKISEIFCEVIIAPGFTEDARELFAKKKNLRLLVSKSGFGPETLQEIRTVPGGYLAQDRDQKNKPQVFLRWSPRDSPPQRSGGRCSLGWRVVRHVKSNAIVYAGDECTPRRWELGKCPGWIVPALRYGKQARQIFPAGFLRRIGRIFSFCGWIDCGRGSRGHGRDSARRKRAG